MMFVEDPRFRPLMWVIYKQQIQTMYNPTNIERSQTILYPPGAACIPLTYSVAAALRSSANTLPMYVPVVSKLM